jgi:hypothetical protein
MRHPKSLHMFLVLLISMAATKIEPFIAGQALGPVCLLAIESVKLLPLVCLVTIAIYVPA